MAWFNPVNLSSDAFVKQIIGSTCLERTVGDIEDLHAPILSLNNGDSYHLVWRDESRVIDGTVTFVDDAEKLRIKLLHRNASTKGPLTLDELKCLNRQVHRLEKTPEGKAQLDMYGGKDNVLSSRKGSAEYDTVESFISVRKSPKNCLVQMANLKIKAKYVSPVNDYAWSGTLLRVGAPLSVLLSFIERNMDKHPALLDVAVLTGAASKYTANRVESYKREGR